MTDVPTPDINAKTDEASIDLSNPLIAALKETEFVADELLLEPNNVPEYNVLELLKEEGPHDLEGIKSKLDNPLLPVAIRNLENADLIKKAGDTYSISPELS